MNKNTTKIILAIVLLCIAGVAILFQLGVIGGSEPIPESALVPEGDEESIEEATRGTMDLPPPPRF